MTEKYFRDIKYEMQKFWGTCYYGVNNKTTKRINNCRLRRPSTGKEDAIIGELTYGDKNIKETKKNMNEYLEREKGREQKIKKNVMMNSKRKSTEHSRK